MKQVIISIASLPGSPERPNEDWAAASLNAVVVLDGVSPPATNGHGCRHSVPWFVRNLGTQFLTFLETGNGDMASALADAIDQVGDLHRDTCDLNHPGTPAAAVAALRHTGEKVEWLVLADTTVVLDTNAGVKAITDTRVDQAAKEERKRALGHRIGTPGHKAAVAHMTREQLKYRNVPDGYWVAATDRQAAAEAITGSVDATGVRQGLLLTDGASWLATETEWYDWRRYLDDVASEGIEQALLLVRRREAIDPDGARHPRYKVSDDATVAAFERDLSFDEAAKETRRPTLPGRDD
jgi:hypothetical protein